MKVQDLVLAVLSSVLAILIVNVIMIFVCFSWAILFNYMNYWFFHFDIEFKMLLLIPIAASILKVMFFPESIVFSKRASKDEKNSILINLLFAPYMLLGICYLINLFSNQHSKTYQDV